MTKYDYDDQAQRTGFKMEPWDYLSIGFLLITLCIGIYFAAIFVSPNSAINPYPPDPFDPNATATFTITPIQPDATWTATPTVEASPTLTLVPTFTPLPSPTFFSLIPPTDTPTPSPTITPSKTPKAPFSADITPIDGTIFHPELAVCSWQAIAGTVVDVNNGPVVLTSVRLVGKFNGKFVGPEGWSLTLSATAPIYGPSGFEFRLDTTVPLASKGDLYLQLLDQSGFPLSENVYIDTVNDCKKNLIMVRFKKNR